jgi:hypothetical protein
MELVPREKLVRFILFTKIFCVLAAFGLTGLLLFKDIYFYTWEEKGETISYSIPMVFLFFFWIKYRLDEKNAFQLSMIGTDLAAVLLAAARILGLFWHSGHVLFISYTYLSSKSKTYRLLCIPFAAMTIGAKLYWGDLLTPILGAILALIIFGIRKYFEKRMHI